MSLLRVSTLRSNGCGAQVVNHSDVSLRVRVWDPSGKEYISAGGDMFIWDGCLECKELGGHKVDFSGMSFLIISEIPSID